jgi:hypothetical protein
VASLRSCRTSTPGPKVARRTARCSRCLPNRGPIRRAAEGEKTSGEVYFDVTGDATDSVVYNAGGDDLLVWTQPQASALRSPRSADGRFFPAQTGTDTRQLSREPRPLPFPRPPPAQHRRPAGPARRCPAAARAYPCPAPAQPPLPRPRRPRLRAARPPSFLSSALRARHSLPAPRDPRLPPPWQPPPPERRTVTPSSRRRGFRDPLPTRRSRLRLRRPPPEQPVEC